MTEISALLSDVLNGYRLTEKEATYLLNTKDRDILRVASAADEMRERHSGNVVTFVKNQNLHVTNICKNLCGFCGFGRSADDKEAYCYDKATIQAKVRLALKRGVTEICPLSGVHPDFSVETYCDLISWVHEVGPHLHLHAFSPDEVSHAAGKSDLSSSEVLERLKSSGLGSLQGTAAEILVDTVRALICPRKLSTDEWVRIIREAHNLGIRSTATLCMVPVRHQRTGLSISVFCVKFRTRPMVLPNWSPSPTSIPILHFLKQALPVQVQRAGKISL